MGGRLRRGTESEGGRGKGMLWIFTSLGGGGGGGGVCVMDMQVAE